MSDAPFLAEIAWVPFDFAPKGWALCNGQLLPINQYQALFSLLGTTYGGDGRVNFALPDLRSRTPIHQGGSHTLGEKGGQEFVTLTQQQLPPHTHGYPVTDHRATSGDPGPGTGSAFASGPRMYAAPGSANASFDPTAVSNAGGNQPHENRQPSLVLTAIIAITNGVFPSQN